MTSYEKIQVVYREKLFTKLTRVLFFILFFFRHPAAENFYMGLKDFMWVGGGFADVKKSYSSSSYISPF